MSVTMQGQCRCGKLLTFTKQDGEYKTRCPECGSVVRLNAPAVSTQTQPHPEPESVATLETIPTPKSDEVIPAEQMEVEFIPLPEPSQSSNSAPTFFSLLDFRWVMVALGVALLIILAFILLSQ